VSVPVAVISYGRISEWLGYCIRDHATPVVLLAVGHDEASGELHVYRPEDGLSDRDLAHLLHAAQVALQER
jgi:hypothetical protein